HEGRRRMPARCRQASEGPVARRLVIQMKALRVVPAREGKDPSAREGVAAVLGLPSDPDVLEPDRRPFAHARLARVRMRLVPVISDVTTPSASIASKRKVMMPISGR